MYFQSPLITKSVEADKTFEKWVARFLKVANFKKQNIRTMFLPFPICTLLNLSLYIIKNIIYLQIMTSTTTAYTIKTWNLLSSIISAPILYYVFSLLYYNVRCHSRNWSCFILNLWLLPYIFTSYNKTISIVFPSNDTQFPFL